MSARLSIAGCLITSPPETLRRHRRPHLCFQRPDRRGANTASEIGDLPAGLKDVFDAATNIAAPFTPTGHAKAMQDQLDEINARAALSPAADPLKSLEDQVAKAELQASLKVAGQLASGEASNAVVILGSAAQSGS